MIKLTKGQINALAHKIFDALKEEAKQDYDKAFKVFCKNKDNQKIAKNIIECYEYIKYHIDNMYLSSVKTKEDALRDMFKKTEEGKELWNKYNINVWNALPELIHSIEIARIDMNTIEDLVGRMVKRGFI